MATALVFMVRGISPDSLRTGKVVIDDEVGSQAVEAAKNALAGAARNLGDDISIQIAVIPKSVAAA
jgi:hypothetical protein